MAAPVIIENLLKLYPEKSGRSVRAVNQINLSINDGEFMVLVGPSGCGKSTTLRMIAGLEEISGGTIRIDGRIVNDVLPKDRDIAMVFQNYALYPHMSVYENLAFGLKLRKIPTAQIEERVHAAAALLGLTDHLDRKPKTLSGGQRQRVAVGRAIVRQPKVFLFDEPLSNLDAKMRVSMRAEIVKLHARLGATMIYVTHDQVEAMTMGDRICVMRDGNIMQTATPLELYNRPANLFVAGFIGSPSMNLLHGTLRSAGNFMEFVEASDRPNPIALTLDAALSNKGATFAGRPIVLGIRPENIHEVNGPGDLHSAASAEVKVEMSEPMGAETYLHLRSEAHGLIARVAPSNQRESGQTMRIGFDLAKAHLFDAASERVLN